MRFSTSNKRLLDMSLGHHLHRRSGAQATRRPRKQTSLGVLSWLHGNSVHLTKKSFLIAVRSADESSKPFPGLGHSFMLITSHPTVFKPRWIDSRATEVGQPEAALFVDDDIVHRKGAQDEYEVLGVVERYHVSVCVVVVVRYPQSLVEPIRQI